MTEMQNPQTQQKAELKDIIKSRRYGLKFAAACFVSAIVTFGFVYLRNDFVKQSLQTSDMNKRITLLTRAVTMGDKQALMLRAITYSDTQNYAAAVEDLNEVIRKMPKYPIAYLYRGTAYIYSNMYKDAITDLDTAQQLLPQYGKQLNMAKYGDEAVSAIESQIIFYKTLALSGQRKFDDAIVLIGTYIEKNPNDYLGYYFRAQLYGHTEQLQLAAEDLIKAKELKDSLAASSPLYGAPGNIEKAITQESKEARRAEQTAQEENLS